MKIIRSALAVALVAGGLTVAAAAAPASAHTPAVTSTCSTVDVSLTQYQTKPAVGEPTIEVENPDYVPAVPGVPEVPEVPAIPEIPEISHTQYLYKQLVTGKTKWKDDFDWNPGLGWYFTGETRKQVTQEYVPGVPGVPGVPAVPEIPAVGEPTIWIENPDYAPGDDAPNTVTVVIDGETVADTTFGSSFAQSFEVFSYEAHDYEVTVTAWDGVGEGTWSGTTEPCAIPVVAANPGATATAECGVANLVLTNEANDYETNLTASFVVLVDGEFAEAPAVYSDEVTELGYSFDEDSGEHTVEVRESFSWEKLAEVTVDSDCEEPPVKPGGPSEPEKPAENPPAKPAPAAPAAPAPAAVTTASSDELAETGYDVAPLAIMAAVGFLLAGGLLGAAAIRRRRAQD